MRASSLITLIAVATTSAVFGYAAAAPSQDNPLPVIQQAMDILAPGFQRMDSYTIDSPKNLLADFPPTNDDGTINVAVEIPAGSGAKWEVKPDGKLHWDFKNEKPRVVQYLPYPGDYGMIPGTRAADGDPLDVLLLAPAVPRGSVVSARIIGVLKLQDKGEQDDKILAVLPDTPLEGITSLLELTEQFPGVCDILRYWFVNYKGPDAMTFGGFGNVDDARKAVDAAAAQYRGKK